MLFRSWANGTQHSSDEFNAMRETAHRLDINFDAYSDAPKAFSIIEQSEWSNGWQEAILSTAKGLPLIINDLFEARDQLTNICQFQISIGTDVAMERLARFMRSLLRTHGRDMSFVFAPNLGDKISGAREFLALLQEYRALENELSVSYCREAIRRIEVNKIEAKWRAAKKKFWFLASFAKKSVSKVLAKQGGTSALPDVSKDAPRLRRMKGIGRAHV